VDETRQPIDSTLVRIDLTGQDVRMSGPDDGDVSRVLTAVLEFGRALLRDDAPIQPAVRRLADVVGATSMALELFVDERSTESFVAGTHDVDSRDHWVPVTLDGAWVGTVSIELDREIRPADRWMLEVVADLFEGWIRRRDVEDALRKTIAEKDRFVATVSHEIRTPLAAVLGLAEELHQRSSSMDPGEVHELLGLVAEQAREVANIVEDLLVLAKAGRATITVAPQQVRLDELVRSAVASIPTGARSGLVMRTVEPVVALCDPLRTRQVVRNLVVNAHRHGGPHTFVDVTSIPGGDAIIRVADNGDQIPEERRTTMFDAFSGSGRADGSLDSVGLGLTVCRELVRAMDGDLFYRWEDESRFDVLLPRPD